MLQQPEGGLPGGFYHEDTRPPQFLSDGGRDLPSTPIAVQPQAVDPAFRKQTHAEPETGLAHRFGGPREIDLTLGKARPIDQRYSGQLVALAQAGQHPRGHEPACFGAGGYLHSLRAYAKTNRLTSDIGRYLFGRILPLG